MYKSKYLFPIVYCFLGLAFAGCEKLVVVNPPKDTITTEQVFSNNTQAEWALAAVYTKMIHGPMLQLFSTSVATENFSTGLTTILGSLSSDELYPTGGPSSGSLYYIDINRLAIPFSDVTNQCWKSAYKIIYDANAVIEGIAGSKPGVLLESVKQQLTGEALTIRAFSYFYLVNFFGDVPLVLTTDVSKTIGMSRTASKTVYQQIVKDLVTAKSTLLSDYSAGKQERVRINKWFAEALLSRVYLFDGQYENAIKSASAIIENTELFKLEDDLNDVFKKESKEAIFQLKPNSSNLATKNATPEGFVFNPVNANSPAMFNFYSDFVQSFAVEDKRKQVWMAGNGSQLHPHKYKFGEANSTPNGYQEEYYVVMRLAEIYLIRAEAQILLSDANTALAIANINVLRPRAGLQLLSNNLNAEDVKVAIANERKFELFAEWGHRWLDLKRTGKAVEVLSTIEVNKPWLGEYQLLYPIPISEIDNNVNIAQNPRYNIQP